MTRTRLIVFMLTLIIVGAVGSAVALYARGYRVNPDTLKLSPNGLLVIKSSPDGAQVFINGELKTATNATIPLPPTTYDISVRKEGYHDWNKRLQIDKEIVTEATATLFKSAPSLSALTFSGSINPIPSKDLTKVAYVVPPSPSSNSTETNEGLWVMETADLPVGFSRQPRRVTDGDLTKANFIWSPDGREILLTTLKGNYLLDAGKFTPQSQRVNVASTVSDITEKWDKEDEVRLDAQLKKLPDELQSILKRKAKSVVFSPDEDMVLYIASGSATIPNNLIPQLPGSSTQKQQRDIVNNQSYIYDIKEDRNFLIDNASEDLVIKGGYTSTEKRRMSWFPTSRHLILAEENSISIMDYDGTNKQTIYTGSYISPHAYPTLSRDRLMILTNLGADSAPPNIYSLSLN